MSLAMVDGIYLCGMYGIGEKWKYLLYKKINHLYNRPQLDTNIFCYDEIANHIERAYVRSLFIGHGDVKTDLEKLEKSRLEQSDFLSQWTGGKVKIRLEKPAANISKLTGGKTEKARRGALHEKPRLDLFFIYRKHWMEIKITEYVIHRQEIFWLKFYDIYTMYSRKK